MKTRIPFVLIASFLFTTGCNPAQIESSDTHTDELSLPLEEDPPPPCTDTLLLQAVDQTTCELPGGGAGTCESTTICSDFTRICTPDRAGTSCTVTIDAMGVSTNSCTTGKCVDSVCVHDSFRKPFTCTIDDDCPTGSACDQTTGGICRRCVQTTECGACASSAPSLVIAGMRPGLTLSPSKLTFRAGSMDPLPLSAILSIDELAFEDGALAPETLTFVASPGLEISCSYADMTNQFFATECQSSPPFVLESGATKGKATSSIWARPVLGSSITQSTVRVFTSSASAEAAMLVYSLGPEAPLPAVSVSTQTTPHYELRHMDEGADDVGSACEGYSDRFPSFDPKCESSKGFSEVIPAVKQLTISTGVILRDSAYVKHEVLRSTKELKYTMRIMSDHLEFEHTTSCSNAQVSVPVPPFQTGRVAIKFEYISGHGEPEKCGESRVSIFVDGEFITTANVPNPWTLREGDGIIETKTYTNGGAFQARVGDVTLSEEDTLISTSWAIHAAESTRRALPFLDLSDSTYIYGLNTLPIPLVTRTGAPSSFPLTSFCGEHTTEHNGTFGCAVSTICAPYDYSNSPISGTGYGFDQKEDWLSNGSSFIGGAGSFDKQGDPRCYRISYSTYSRDTYFGIRSPTHSETNIFTLPGLTGDDFGKGDSCLDDISNFLADSTNITFSSGKDYKEYLETSKCVSAPKLLSSLHWASSTSNRSNYYIQYNDTSGSQYAKQSTSLTDGDGEFLMYLANRWLQTGEIIANHIEDGEVERIVMGLGEPDCDRECGLDILQQMFDVILEPRVQNALRTFVTEGELQNVDFRKSFSWQPSDTGLLPESEAIPPSEVHEQPTPVWIYRTLLSYVDVLEALAHRAWMDGYYDCSELGDYSDFHEAFEQLDKAKLYLQALRNLADTMHETASQTEAAYWDSEFLSLRDLLDAAELRISSMEQGMGQCQNPLGVAEDDIPLFFGDLHGDNSRYFAASDYLFNAWSKPAVSQVAASVQAYRSAWLEKKGREDQDLESSFAKERMLEGIQNEYGRGYASQCGYSPSASVTFDSVADCLENETSDACLAVRNANASGCGFIDSDECVTAKDNFIEELEGRLPDFSGYTLHCGQSLTDAKRLILRIAAEYSVPTAWSVNAGHINVSSFHFNEFQDLVDESFDQAFIDLFAIGVPFRGDFYLTNRVGPIFNSGLIADAQAANLTNIESAINSVVINEVDGVCTLAINEDSIAVISEDFPLSELKRQMEGRLIQDRIDSVDAWLNDPISNDVTRPIFSALNREHLLSSPNLLLNLDELFNGEVFSEEYQRLFHAEVDYSSGVATARLNLFRDAAIETAGSNPNPDPDVGTGLSNAYEQLSSCFTGQIGTLRNSLSQAQTSYLISSNASLNAVSNAHRKYEGCVLRAETSTLQAELQDQVEKSRLQVQQLNSETQAVSSVISSISWDAPKVLASWATTAGNYPTQQANLVQSGFENATNSALRSTSITAELEGCLLNAQSSVDAANLQLLSLIADEQSVFAARHALSTALNEVEASFKEGPAKYNVEMSRISPSKAHHMWIDERKDRFINDFAWAQRVSYLAAKAMEYEFQQSLSVKDAILEAQLPNDLQNAVNEMEREQAARTINRARPQEATTVLSLRKDILPTAYLRMEDESAFNGDVYAYETHARDIQVSKLQRMLVSDKYAMYDPDGLYMGQGIPFRMSPQGELRQRCGERLWTVSASLQGFNLNIDQPVIPLYFMKRNTFESQWCDGHGDGSQFQTGGIRPSANLFRDQGETTSEAQTQAFTWSLLQPYVNTPRNEFYRETYAEGSTEELAGRGLYGDYILLFPWDGLLEYDFGIQNVEDVLLRFDYLSVANGPELSQ